jgi:hypothetical protein
MKRRCLAQFCRDGVVLGFYFGSEPIKGLREAAGAELQAETMRKTAQALRMESPLALLRSAAKAG